MAGELTPRQRRLLNEGRCPACSGSGRRLLQRERDGIHGMMVSGPSRCLDCDGTGKTGIQPGELLVERDARFYEMQILSVEEHLAHFRIGFVAERAEWFDSDADGADDDGWVRDITKITGELSIGSEEQTVRERWGTWLRAWEREARTDLTGFASFDAQAIGVGHARSQRWVAAKLSPDALDQPGN